MSVFFVKGNEPLFFFFKANGPASNRSRSGPPFSKINGPAIGFSYGSRSGPTIGNGSGMSGLSLRGVSNGSIHK